MHTKKEFMKLSADFKECRDVLVALGDENRLHILYQMMITADPMGMRVGDIVKMSSLSRPAVCTTFTASLLSVSLAAISATPKSVIIVPKNIPAARPDATIFFIISAHAPFLKSTRE